MYPVKRTHFYKPRFAPIIFYLSIGVPFFVKLDANIDKILEL